MKHTYEIHGMTCNGCRSKVEKTLNKIPGVTSAEVSLENAEATIVMEKHIPNETMQAALSAAGNYSIGMKGSGEAAAHHAHAEHHHSHAPPNDAAAGKYYCPMMYEGDKVYDQPGSCPVCGMNLEKVPELNTSTGQYTCPMHPEIAQFAEWIWCRCPSPMTRKMRLTMSL